MPLAAPLLGAVYGSTGNVSTHVLNVPGGTSSGQRMLAVLAASNGVTTFAASDSGWTEIYQNFDGATATSSGTKVAVYQRTAGASEPNSYTFTSQSRTVTGQIIAYPGSTASVTTAVDATRYGSATTAPTAPSLNPTPFAQARLLYVGVGRGINIGEAVVDRTPPGTMTERSDATSASAGTVNIAFVLADEQLSAGGATGTRVGGFASPGTRGFAVSMLVYPDDEVVNNEPVASAGIDQTSNVNQLVTLDGSGSTDVEGIASYAWSQLSGPTVSLSGAGTVNPSFTSAQPGTYLFRLTVTDTNSATDTDDVVITVYPEGVKISTFASGTSGTPAAVIPASAVAGDTAVFLIAAQGNGSDVALPAGWIPTFASSSSTSSSGASIRAAYKRLTADDLGDTVSWTLSMTNRWNAVIVAVEDLHALHPVLRSLGNIRLSKPEIDGPVVVGTPGSTTYEYVATAINEAGETTASVAAATTVGPAVLSSSNSIRVWFDPIAGANTYNVYGRTAGGPYQLIGMADNTNVTGVSTNQKRGITDTGATPGPQIPPSAYPDVVHWDARDADNPGRLQTSFTGGLVLHAAALRLGTGAADFALAAAPTGSVFLGQKLHAENQVLLAVAFEELSGSGNLLSGRTSAFNHATEQWTTLSIILRPSGANGPPTALAGGNRTFQPGEKIYLDAKLSYDLDEDALSYSWTQTGGPSVTLYNANTLSPWFITPNGPATLTFQLTVTDPSSSTDTDTTIIAITSGSTALRVYHNGSFHDVPMQTYQNGAWS